MPKDDYPFTPAIRAIRTAEVEFIPHLFVYKDKGGTSHTAIELSVPEHNVIKTLVMETESGAGLIVLMHGDYEVSTKELARQIGVKSVSPCDGAKAEKLTGYQFGGTSPFGTRTKLPLYAESSIFGLDIIYIHGGKRGFIIEIKPEAIKKVLSVEEVSVAVKK